VWKIAYQIGVVRMDGDAIWTLQRSSHFREGHE